MKKNLSLTLALLTVLSFCSVSNQAQAFKFFHWKKHKAVEQVPMVTESTAIDEVKVETHVQKIKQQAVKPVQKATKPVVQTKTAKKASAKKSQHKKTVVKKSYKKVKN